MQPQGHVQVLLNILRGMTPQAALDAPRFCISAGLPDADDEDANNQNIGDINSEVYIEEGVPEEVVAKLNGEWAEKTRWIVGTMSLTCLGSSPLQIRNGPRCQTGQRILTSHRRSGTGEV
jgi:gamma-glutamyltranspeptidase